MEQKKKPLRVAHWCKKYNNQFFFSPGKCLTWFVGDPFFMDSLWCRFFLPQKPLKQNAAEVLQQLLPADVLGIQ